MADTVDNTGNTDNEEGKYSVTVFCEACGEPTNIELIGVKHCHVCDDVTSMWVQQVQQG